MLHSALFWIAGLAAAATALVGAAFVVAPAASLAWGDHTAEKLPQAFGGRYIFFALMLGFGLWSKDLRMLAAVFAGLAVVALIDAAIYRASDPLPHLLAAIACAALAAACVHGRLA